MPDPTSNHGYNRPDPGTTDWNIPINENAELLDADVEIRDAKQEMDTYEPKAGAKFLALTTPAEVWIGDGNAWNFLGIIPETIPDGGRTRSLQQLLSNGRIVGVGNDYFTIWNPSDYTRPVHDAMRDVAEGPGAGTVFLPYGAVEEAGMLTRLRGYVNLIGQVRGGPQGGREIGSEIEWTQPGAAGLVGAESGFERLVNMTVQNVYLNGRAASRGWDTGPAMWFRDTNMYQNSFQNITFRKWGAPAIYTPGGQSHYACKFDLLRTGLIEPQLWNDNVFGGNAAVIHWAGGSVGNHWRLIEVYPSDNVSEVRSRAVYMNGVHTIDMLQVGGTASRALDSFGGAKRVGNIWWEPTEVDTGAGEQAARDVVRLTEEGRDRIGSVHFATESAAADHCYYLHESQAPPGYKELGPVWARNSDAPFPPAESILHVEDAPSGPIMYSGWADDVTMGYTGDTNMIVPLYELTTTIGMG